MLSKPNNLTNRTIYFDYLRVFATFAVMILHISAQNWSTTDVNGMEWQVFNFYDSIVRWGVPVFVMISGALFLNRDIPLKTIYSKNILRMIISFLVWSALYSVYKGNGITGKLALIINGRYHMWFVLMIVGLYMCIPIIKPIVETKERTIYFLALAFVFAFAVPEIMMLIMDFGSETLIKASNVINDSIEKLDINMVLGFTSYFVLGYFIHKTDLTTVQRRIIYFLGIVGFAFTIIMDLIVAIKTQQCCDHYYGNFNVNILLEAIAVFTWFKYKGFKCEKLNAFIQKLSKYSFGAYLVHIFVIELLSRVGLNSLSFNPILSVICIGVVVFVISFTISGVLNHIPIVKKYMV